MMVDPILVLLPILHLGHRQGSRSPSCCPRPSTSLSTSALSPPSLMTVRMYVPVPMPWNRTNVAGKTTSRRTTGTRIKRAIAPTTTTTTTTATTTAATTAIYSVPQPPSKTKKKWKTMKLQGTQNLKTNRRMPPKMITNHHRQYHHDIPQRISTSTGKQSRNHVATRNHHNQHNQQQPQSPSYLCPLVGFIFDQSASNRLGVLNGQVATSKIQLP